MYASLNLNELSFTLHNMPRDLDYKKLKPGSVKKDFVIWVQIGHCLCCMHREGRCRNKLQVNYRKISNISHTKSKHSNASRIARSCLCATYWSQVLSGEWRCSWSSADRRCFNYIWLINNLIACKDVTYIRDLTVVFQIDSFVFNALLSQQGAVLQ